MIASIVSMKSLRDGSEPSADEVPPSSNQFDIYVGCLMTTSYSLSESLLGPTSESAVRALDEFVDDRALLTKIAAHRDHVKLSRLLLGLVMVESARSSLWSEIERHLKDST